MRIVTKIKKGMRKKKGFVINFKTNKNYNLKQQGLKKISLEK